MELPGVTIPSTMIGDDLATASNPSPTKSAIDMKTLTSKLEHQKGEDHILEILETSSSHFGDDGKVGNDEFRKELERLQIATIYSLVEKVCAHTFLLVTIGS